MTYMPLARFIAIVACTCLSILVVVLAAMHSMPSAYIGLASTGIVLSATAFVVARASQLHRVNRMVPMLQPGDWAPENADHVHLPGPGAPEAAFSKYSRLMQWDVSRYMNGPDGDAGELPGEQDDSVDGEVPLEVDMSETCDQETMGEITRTLDNEGECHDFSPVPDGLPVDLGVPGHDEAQGLDRGDSDRPIVPPVPATRGHVLVIRSHEFHPPGTVQGHETAEHAMFYCPRCKFDLDVSRPSEVILYVCMACKGQLIRVLRCRKCTGNLAITQETYIISKYRAVPCPICKDPITIA